MDDSATVMEGAVTITYDGDYTAKQLLISHASGLMKVLFSTLGMPKKEGEEVAILPGFIFPPRPQGRVHPVLSSYFWVC